MQKERSQVCHDCGRERRVREGSHTIRKVPTEGRSYHQVRVFVCAHCARKHARAWLEERRTR